MRYQRSKCKGGTFFLTIVTYRRQKIFIHHENVLSLKNVIKKVKLNHPFILEAMVILPDHLHFMLTLPLGDDDFSTRCMLIKSYFTRGYDYSLREKPTISRFKKREQCIWQRRFWEHQIRDTADFHRHIDYIHYNPVKHNLCKSPKDWPYSSFHQYVHNGVYDINWGLRSIVPFEDDAGHE